MPRYPLELVLAREQRQWVVSRQAITTPRCWPSRSGVTFACGQCPRMAQRLTWAHLLWVSEWSTSSSSDLSLWPCPLLERLASGTPWPNTGRRRTLCPSWVSIPRDHFCCWAATTDLSIISVSGVELYKGDFISVSWLISGDSYQNNQLKRISVYYGDIFRVQYF